MSSILTGVAICFFSFKANLVRYLASNGEIASSNLAEGNKFLSSVCCAFLFDHDEMMPFASYIPRNAKVTQVEISFLKYMKRLV